MGRQTPGGNNIVDGLLRFAAQRGDTEVIGFLNGTLGMFEGKHLVVTEENFRLYRNQGGYDFLGRSADQIRRPEQLKATLAACQNLSLSGLVLVGATHTFTDAAYLTEYFYE